MAAAVGVRAAPAPGLARARVPEEPSGGDTERGGESGGEDGKGTTVPGSPWAPGAAERAAGSCSPAGVQPRLRVRMCVLPWQDSDGEQEDSPAARARQQLEALLNKTMRIRMTDGRTLVGCFLCTDRDCNVILGSAQEFLKPSDSFSAGEPRVLGLAMVPGHHIVSIEVQRESLAGTPYL
ncbi:N-alpha-acetyltransferase 38, NatC auxiliary subunit isoform X1 [Meriones unguiculatus]|uniref:N-alpha-acetyltransferase 38, NatC auxiliary subunit isoform X1 n=1 Tax=Meriones unguiculatus TaxID=10047 RepID=UPI000B4FC1FA|nr:N-alpha-acetyltransferase 38, NatC auxiliary subunit isoform X1 [Meriones unguiculatus]